MISLKDYEIQKFTDEQEFAVSDLHNAIVKHFEVMGIDPEYTEDVWEYIDRLITHIILNDYKEES